MSRSPRSFLTFVFATLTLAPLAASAQTLGLYKDELFTNRNRKILETRNDDTYKRYAYDEMTDVNGRDEIPVKKAKAERIDPDGALHRRSLIIGNGDSAIDTFEVGNPKNAKFAVIFVHGGGGTKLLGANDQTFGGNFARIQGLATRNGGVYYSPSVSFDSQGDRAVENLIQTIRAKSPSAKIVISCGSAGARTCWQMGRSLKVGSQLSGIMLLGGAIMDDSFVKSPAFAAKVPVLISHGTKDPVLRVAKAAGEYELIRSRDREYPVRFESYEGGKHGTPIRMVDWRENLEWMFANAPLAQARDAQGSGKPVAPSRGVR